LDAQSLVWFGVAGGSTVFALSLLNARYVKKEQRAVSSRGGFTLFAILMLIFAAGAFVAGLASAS
jgi:hypothetical protein